MKIFNFSLIIASALLISACSKTDNETSNDKNKINEKGTVSQQEKTSKKIEKPDKGFPKENYQLLTGGKQLVFAYYAINNDKIDYEIIAKAISQPYNNEVDEFKKRDLLATLKPQIDESIEKAKQNKYYKVEEFGNLTKYDFESKSFSDPEVYEIKFQGPDGEKSSKVQYQYKYFVDSTSQFQFGYTNSLDFKSIHVPDETLAREIESLRTSRPGLKRTIYFFANDTEENTKNIKSEIVKVVISDSKGNVILEK